MEQNKDTSTTQEFIDALEQKVDRLAAVCGKLLTPQISTDHDPAVYIDRNAEKLKDLYNKTADFVQNKNIFSNPIKDVQTKQQQEMFIRFLKQMAFLMGLREMAADISSLSKGGENMENTLEDLPAYISMHQVDADSPLGQFLRMFFN